VLLLFSVVSESGAIRRAPEGCLSCASGIAPALVVAIFALTLGIAAIRGLAISAILVLVTYATHPHSFSHPRLVWVSWMDKT
jgi:hypothetical protein